MSANADQLRNRLSLAHQERWLTSRPEPAISRRTSSF